MGRRKDDRPRCRGPYRHRDGWYIETIIPEAAGGTGRATSDYFGTEAEALEFKEIKERKLKRLHGVTFDEALTEYREFLVTTGHKKPSTEDSADETCRRLRLFFEGAINWRVGRLEEDAAGDLYKEFTKRTYVVGGKKKRREKPYSAAHHRHTLAQAKSFMRWCVRPQKWIASSPLEDVKGIGVVSVGKEQLTGTESIKFYRLCADRALDGDHAALGLLMCLLMALRNGDVRKRVVRDVDLDGTVLRIGVGSSARSKTKKGDRPRRIPSVLQVMIKRAAHGRDALAPLFPAADGGFHTKSWLKAAAKRLCKAAEVPYVTPHGLKGTTGTLATEAGALADAVAEYLSHTSTATGRHYVADGAAANAKAARALEVIVGGKR